MMKEVLRSLDAGMLPQIGLFAFIIAFALIIARVVLMSKAERKNAKELPLDDGEEIRLPSNNE